MAQRKHDCQRQDRSGYLLSGYRQPGDLWRCPKCGQLWRHECDEAEGCEWVPA